MGRYAATIRRFLLHHVLHADDSPHRIAFGVGIAVLVAFLPLVGFQTLIAIGLAALLRANKAVCVPIVWITNPLTLWPIYGGCLALGRLIVPTANAGSQADVAGLGDVEMNILALESWKRLLHLLINLGIELWVGCLLVGVALGVMSYVTARWAVSTYRERRQQRLLRRHLRRSDPPKGKVPRRTEVAARARV